MNIKTKLNFFSHNKLKFQPRTYNYSVNFDDISSILFNVNLNMNSFVF